MLATFTRTLSLAEGLQRHCQHLSWQTQLPSSLKQISKLNSASTTPSELFLLPVQPGAFAAVFPVRAVLQNWLTPSLHDQFHLNCLQTDAALLSNCAYTPNECQPLVYDDLRTICVTSHACLLPKAVPACGHANYMRPWVQIQLHISALPAAEQQCPAQGKKLSFCPLSRRYHLHVSHWLSK